MGGSLLPWGKKGQLFTELPFSLFLLYCPQMIVLKCLTRFSQSFQITINQL